MDISLNESDNEKCILNDVMNTKSKQNTNLNKINNIQLINDKINCNLIDDVKKGTVNNIENDEITKNDSLNNTDKNIDKNIEKNIDKNIDKIIDKNTDKNIDKIEYLENELQNITDCNEKNIKKEIKFEKKKKKSKALKEQRKNDIIIAYWLKGIIKILTDGLQNNEIKGSYVIAKQIAEILKKIVEVSHWNNVHELIELIKFIEKEIIKNNKMNFVISNIIRRFLKIIRVEHFKQLYLYNNNYNEQKLNKNEDTDINQMNNIYHQDINNFMYVDVYKQIQNNYILYKQKKKKSFYKSFDIYFEDTQEKKTYQIPATNTLKHSIIEGISELIAEIDSVWDESEQRPSYDLFVENDIILTLGYSLAVEKFLKNIHKKKSIISVIVVGGDIQREGYKMTNVLREDNLNVTYISDSAVYAIIPKVSKIIINCFAVCSSGGVITKIGGYNIACSANFYSKPVVIILPILKLFYIPIFDPIKQNELQSGPPNIYEHFNDNLYIKIPKYDYIPEHLITLYITELGPLNSFQIYNIAKKKFFYNDI